MSDLDSATVAPTLVLVLMLLVVALLSARAPRPAPEPVPSAALALSSFGNFEGTRRPAAPPPGTPAFVRHFSVRPPDVVAPFVAPHDTS